MFHEASVGVRSKFQRCERACWKIQPGMFIGNELTKSNVITAWTALFLTDCSWATCVAADDYPDKHLWPFDNRSLMGRCGRRPRESLKTPSLKKVQLLFESQWQSSNLAIQISACSLKSPVQASNFTALSHAAFCQKLSIPIGRDGEFVHLRGKGCESGGVAQGNQWTRMLFNDFFNAF